jgi:hypothetical protein
MKGGLGGGGGAVNVFSVPSGDERVDLPGGRVHVVQPAA